MGIRITKDEITPNLQSAPKKLDAAIWATMNAYSPRVQGHAQSNAPWQDQTGNARGGLKARPGRDSDSFWIDLFHTMPYGIYLETRWSGRYQVIVPTIDKFGSEVMGTISGVLQRI